MNLFVHIVWLLQNVISSHTERLIFASQNSTEKEKQRK